MTESNVSLLVRKYENKIDEKSRKELLEILPNVDDAAIEPLKEIKMKSIPATLLLSLLLGVFAAGRLYLGDYAYAIKKTVTILLLNLLANLTWLTPLVKLVPAFGWGLAIPVAAACAVWCVVDIFSCLNIAALKNGSLLLARVRQMTGDKYGLTAR